MGQIPANHARRAKTTDVFVCSHCKLTGFLKNKSMYNMGGEKRKILTSAIPGLTKLLYQVHILPFYSKNTDPI